MDASSVAPGAGPTESDAASAAEIAQIQAFIGGDMLAFKYVYAKYRQRIFSYCLYVTGDKTLAEDAFQETFARAYTRREQLKEPKALKSWLLLISRSVCLNMLRTSKFTPDFVYLDAKDPEEGEGYVHRELTTQAHDLGSSDALRHALQRLAPMYREAFLLREFEGYSYEEIGEMTGASVMNVKVRITRAKKQLRKLLAPHDPANRTQTVDQSRQSSTATMEEDSDLAADMQRNVRDREDLGNRRGPLPRPLWA